MAARNFNTNGIKTLDREIVMLFGVVTFGTASIASQSSVGFTVTRTDVGKFTITLADAYNQLLGCTFTWFSATPASTDPLLTPIMVTETVATVATKAITFETWDAESPAATEPISGDKLFIQVTLRNSATSRLGA
jgi:hypothetical protein